MGSRLSQKGADAGHSTGPAPNRPAKETRPGAIGPRAAPPPTKKPPPVAVEPARIRVVTLNQGQSVWAQILVDGKRIGTSPIARHPLAPGRHVVTARRVGYIEARTVIQVRGGEKRKVTIDLERTAP